MSAFAINPVLIADSPVSTDAELIERFVVARDQAAFAELVRRHSAIVLGVCRRVLHDPHDIDDVFQATFLVLVRDAARVRKRQSLASWLYGVAYRISLRLARSKQRRREINLVEETLIDDDTLGRLTDRHDQQLVDMELNSLPERYRQPLVLKYLSGHSTDEIATELGTTVGAVEGLLKRGKDELRRRLLQKGLTLGVALAGIQVTQQMAQGAGTQSLIESTIQAGLAWDARTGTISPDVVSDHAVELAAKEMIAMTTTTKSVLAVGLTVGGLALGLGGTSMLLAQSTGNADAAPLVSTLSVSGRAQQSLELATLAAEPLTRSEASKPADPTKRVANHTTDESQKSLESKTPTGGDNKLTYETSSNSGWDMKKRSPNVQKIEKALQNPTEVSFTNQPLIEALNYLEDLHHIEIMIDEEAVREQGISTTHNVDLVVAGINLKNTLRLLLDPQHLDYLIKNDVLMITSRDKANETFETRVYNVGLLPDYTPKELMEIILTTVDPDGWNIDASIKSFSQTNPLPQIGEKNAETVEASVGTGIGGMGGGVGMGGGGISSDSSLGVIRVSKKTLVIRQKQRVHDEIVELLDQLR